ncbi:TOG array regulator of axonemal microtubules protein 2-like [Zonotrichia albicollis]|uniref:TOG array regulator of axonemal microtubules protein 2-like n=1 Tax=Zonotrichia albicollis TaxID=44394 RepID=UPI003D811466
MADTLLTVTPQMATGAKRREELLHGHGQKDRAFSDPQQSLQEALSMLGSDDWELKKKGLFNITRLAESHAEVLLCRLREICLAVTSEVTNLQSKASCSAIITLGELFGILKKDMDSEADEVAGVLLPMVWNSPEFIQKAACQSLGMIVENVTPAQAMTALMDRGVKSRYVQIFDYFVLRINDTHKRVKEKALDVLAEITGLLEDALNPVMNCLVEGITRNLNAKDPRVHATAVKALNKSVAHLVLVEWVYARSPEVVQRYTLPVLWSCLENKVLLVRSANVCAVVTKLACALCEVMGTQLIKCADSKPPHMQENLSSLLGW